ncbi:hypothetical protein GPLA_3446 [Paraglaciecola polaris LMG 21857]|uniref:Uncharacterized protein n=1 Tax=Paraglaciecola polaris LMG 21857 TaxID=1129793 RepID=K7AGF4_9ALTE|nr:hypothetical protein GPLA_3446 [Paraglaciecola polaris LMG 21857]
MQALASPTLGIIFALFALTETETESKIIISNRKPRKYLCLYKPLRPLD